MSSPRWERRAESTFYALLVVLLVGLAVLALAATIVGVVALVEVT